MFEKKHEDAAHEVCQSDKSPWLIIGHYGGNNTGDEAMLCGLLTALHTRFPGAQSMIVRKCGKSESWLSELPVNVISPSLLRVIAALFASRGVILGGGTHFHDDYSFSRYIKHLRYLVRIVGVCWLARISGRNVYWLGMGFGPLTRTTTQWVTRAGLRLCSRVTVRDDISLRVYKGLCKHGEAIKAFDLAALMPRGQQRIGKVSTNILGVSLTSVASCSGSERTSDQRVQTILRKALIVAMSDHPDWTLRVFVIRGGDREDDQDCSAGLYRDARNAGVSVELIEYDPDPRVMYEKIRECRAFVASRFHAAVLAYLAHCRLLCLAYHRKVSELAREIGLPDCACVSIRSERELECLGDKVDSMLNGNTTFRANFNVDTARKMAERNLDVLPA